MSLALVAAAEPMRAAMLGIAMLGYQVSIGALNDVVDEERDRRSGPGAPIPAGLVTREQALAIVVVGGTVGSVISATFGVAVLLLGTLGYGCGLAYDLVMRAMGWGWLCFSAAFPLLLAWTWLAAAGTLPPGSPLLLPLAALAGPAIHIANGLVDAEADRGGGTQSLATILGPERARVALLVLVAAVYALGWAALIVASSLSPVTTSAAIGATAFAAIGVALSWRSDARAREAGWLLQAVGLAVLAVTWAAAILPA